MERIENDDNSVAFELIQRQDGLFQARGFFGTTDDWSEIWSSGLYADRDTARADAIIWMEIESRPE